MVHLGAMRAIQANIVPLASVDNDVKQPASPGCNIVSQITTSSP
jgi:hypothetical protein